MCTTSSAGSVGSKAGCRKCYDIRTGFEKENFTFFTLFSASITSSHLYPRNTFVLLPRLVVVTQIRGHITGSPSLYGRRLRFNGEKDSACLFRRRLSSNTRVNIGTITTSNPFFALLQIYIPNLTTGEIELKDQRHCSIRVG